MSRPITAVTLGASLCALLLTRATDAAECVTQSPPDRIPAAKLITLSADAQVGVTFCGGNAGYSSEVFLARPYWQYIGTGHSTSEGTTVDLGAMRSGDELVFGIYVGATEQFYTAGPGDRNPDAAVHAAVTDLGGGIYHVGFEDIYGGGDRDYDDINIMVESFGLEVVAPGPSDLDGDGTSDYDDNCLLVTNPDQADEDLDAFGDACDVCPGDYANTCAADTDADDDGVPDGSDACPTTAGGNVINDNGCSIADLAPCQGAQWKNHGAYVSAVTKLAKDFYDAGLITKAERQAIVRDAAASSCGK